MSWETHWSTDAVMDLLGIARTSTRQAERVALAVEVLARSEQGDVRKLADRPDEWRLRVGDWRVIFTFDGAAQTMTVLEVRRRNERTYRD